MTVRELVQELLEHADLDDVLILNDPREDWHILANYEVRKDNSAAGVAQLKEVK